MANGANYAGANLCASSAPGWPAQAFAGGRQVQIRICLVCAAMQGSARPRGLAGSRLKCQTRRQRSSPTRLQLRGQQAGCLGIGGTGRGVGGKCSRPGTCRATSAADCSARAAGAWQGLAAAADRARWGAGSMRLATFAETRGSRACFLRGRCREALARELAPPACRPNLIITQTTHARSQSKATPHNCVGDHGSCTRL